MEATEEVARVAYLNPDQEGGTETEQAESHLL